MFASKKGRIAALASAVTAVGVGAIAATMVLGGGTGGAHAATAGATYAGAHMTISRTSSSSTMPTTVKLNPMGVACSNPTTIPYTGPCSGAAGDDGASSTTPSKHRPKANGPFNHTPTKASGVGNASAHANANAFANPTEVAANFNGLNDNDNVPLIGGQITPPDQALCVGAAGPFEAAGILPSSIPANTSVVVEGVNEALAVYSKSGAVLAGPYGLASVFNDPYASGDITCHYDSSTQSYYFGEIGVLLSGPDAFNYGTDLAVISPNGYSAYQVDTSENANCFPDFPHQGFDANAFYLTINEFCGAQENFVGSAIYAFTKSELVALDTTIDGVMFGNLAPGGTPVLTLQPAFGGSPSTEYLVNANVYDAAGNNVNSSNSLGLWSVTGDQNIASNPSAVTLSGTSIASETYGFPVNPASTGNGKTTCVSLGFTINCDGGIYVTSENYLNPDDSRMEQVQYVNTANGPRLYTSLNTALSVGNDPHAYDGAAWFEIDPAGQKVTDQGYVGSPGTNLLYPSILVGNTGTMALDFSLTSPSLNPSTGYSLFNASSNSFGAIKITGLGNSPHYSFCDVLCNEARWGDYSAAEADPNSGDIWVADEFIPAAGNQRAASIDNWGTEVWDISVSH